MKREILFRGKRLDNGEWVEGSLINANDGYYIFDRDYNAIHEDPEYHDQGMGCGLEDRNITDRYEAMAHGWECALERIVAELPEYVEIDPATIGQYTGLKDKRGVRIFEGDVVKWDDCSDGRYWRVAVVKIDPDLQFKCLDSFNGLEGSVKGHTFRFGNFIYKDTEHHLYITGTIHDNPELVEAP